MRTLGVQEELDRRVAQLLHVARRSGRRQILGIVGPPGAGKSTISKWVLEAVGPSNCAIAPMDGFHLAQRLLSEDLSERRGAPDTFDASGYLQLLRRIRNRDEVEVYAPVFRRRIGDAIGSAVAIARDVPLVIAEGNYLLSDDEPWSFMRELIDETWFVTRDHEERMSDLVARHKKHGKTSAEATDWSNGPDERNAQYISASAERADLIVDLSRGSVREPGTPVEELPQ